MVKKHAIDFSKVKRGGNFTKRHLPEGDYKARIAKVEDAESSSDGEDMWLFTIELVDKARATYPHYCKLVANQYWKIRNLFESAGVVLPSKKVNIDPTKVVGKKIGVALRDEEYEGRMNSEIDAVFSLSEISKGSKSDADDDEDEEEEEEEVEEEETEEEVEDEDEDEDEESEADRKKRLKKERAKARRAKQEKQAKKGKKKPKDDDEDEEEDDELEELEIEDL